MVRAAFLVYTYCPRNLGVVQEVAATLHAGGVCFGLDSVWRFVCQLKGVPTACHVITVCFQDIQSPAFLTPPYALPRVCQQSVLDSEEYSLWAAFMKPDSPPGSPCPSSVQQGASAFSPAEEKDDGVEDGKSTSTASNMLRECCFFVLSWHPT